jgi:hypothetical protein
VVISKLLNFTFSGTVRPRVPFPSYVLGEDLAYLLRNRLVDLEARLSEDQVRALPLGGDRWHGRSDSELAGFGARGRDDTALVGSDMRA